MIRARSLTSTALACAAFGWLVASGCSKPRNTNPPSNNASVGASTDTTANGTYGGATPANSTTTKGNSLSTNPSDTGRSLAGASTQTRARTHHRSRTGRHTYRHRADTSAAGAGAVMPTRTDTTGANQFAMNTPRSSTGVGAITGSTGSATNPSATSPSSSAGSTAAQQRDTTAGVARDTTVGQAKSDTSWLYGGSHAAHKDTALTANDSLQRVNPTDTSRLGVGAANGTCSCVTPNQPTASNQPNYPNANCSAQQQTNCNNNTATASCPAGQLNCQNQSASSDTTGQAARVSTYGGTVSSDTGRAGAALSDGQIADIVVIANTADSTMGALATRRSTNQQVKDFARQMMQDHGANNRQVTQLAQRVNVAPVTSDDSRNLRNDADEAMRNVQGKSGADFDRAYIDHEVDMHERVLRTLDEKLIPSADNAELKTLLQQTRGVINQHLQRAREIQSSLRQQ